MRVTKSWRKRSTRVAKIFDVIDAARNRKLETKSDTIQGPIVNA